MTQYKPLTPADVVDFAEYMSEQYQYTIVSLEGNIFKAAKFALKKVGIDVDAYMPNTGLVLPYKGECFVCLNFELGRVDKLCLTAQIEAIFHESTHAIQAGKKGYRTFYNEYIFHESKRAVMEAQAFSMGDGWRYLYTGKLSSNQSMTTYLLSDKSAELAAKAYKKAMELVVFKGAMKRDPMAVGVKWLKDRGVM